MSKGMVLAIGAIAVALILYSFRDKIKKVMTRAYINNNPGNIVKTYDSKGYQTFWSGEIPGKDTRFKTFKSMAYGYRALIINLQSYIKSGTNTIESIINKWAPPVENNTEGYKQRVANETGISRTTPIPSTDYKILASIAAAISQVESGIPANHDDIQAGVKIMTA